MKKLKKIALIIIVSFVVIWIAAVTVGVIKHGGWSNYWGYLDIENHKDQRYYEKIVNDGELTIYFKDFHGTNNEIYWKFKNGEIVDYYADNKKYKLSELWDCRFIRNFKIGRSDISFESPENAGQTLNGEKNNYHYELELSFSAPKDSLQSKYDCKGSVNITGIHANGDGSSSSESYDADVVVKLNNTSSKSNSQQNVDETIEGAKSVLEEESTKKDTNSEKVVKTEIKEVKPLPLVSDSLGIYTEGDDTEQSRVNVFTSICITGTTVFVVNTNAWLTFEDMKLTINKNGYMKLERFVSEEDWTSLDIDFNKKEAFLMLADGDYYKFYLRKNWE